MIWIAGLVVAFALLLWLWVPPKIVEFRKSIGLDAKIAEAETLWVRVRLQTQGLKTILAGAVGMIAAIAPEIVKELAGVDLSPLIGLDWGGKVAVATAVMTTVFHVVGIVSAAEAEPVKEDA
ncbi:hypothetical protein [Methylocapsa aurea]|uniref:hypothetical protein n=1 Tax=Methylocapsa aurea TaxID=663610 RepID=UPI0012EC756D|nr:hypothetical protein [Methylocapsa aurea]